MQIAFIIRQFITRTNANKDAVKEFEELLQEKCSLEALCIHGQPSVKELAKIIGYSPNYLSDMLKKETGKTGQEHIKLFIFELAKHFLSSTEKPVYEIAYQLGFDQPSSFTKFMKLQSGVTPITFRKNSRV